LFNAQHIHIEGLSDAQASKVGIQKAIAAISAKVKPWDSFILFVASHGFLQDNQYYIVTADFDGVIDTTKMISSNEIVGMSKNIKSLSQLLIFDTCHAGGVDNIIGGLYDARMSVMAKKMGLHIYASAGSKQTALDGYKGNGLFTHALLKSIAAGSTTDSNHDNEISVAELGEQARQETLAISTTLGFAQSPNIINFGKDNALFRLGGKVAATDCTLCPDMVVIPAGSFNMGSNTGRSDEKPLHRVNFAKPFSMGKTEVTQAQWHGIMGSNPSQHKGCNSCPVEQVSWDDAQAYIKTLNAKTGRQYRLPSEAEWEYACRAGGQHEFCGSDAIDSIAWYGGHTPDIPKFGQPDKATGNSRSETHPVATKQPNAWGLFDMSGNVAEWVEDSYHGKYINGVSDGSYLGAPSDGSAWMGDGTRRVRRGGEYYGMAWKGETATELARAARRDLGGPESMMNSLGFRLVSDDVMDSRKAETKPAMAFKDCPECPAMIVIPAGSFEMGSENFSEKPIHTVTIAKNFALGKTEVTQAEWRAMMGNNPSRFISCGDNCPVEQVSWEDAQAYIQKLNIKTGGKYRLPSEAEWEYACRAGKDFQYCGSDDLNSVAWYYVKNTSAIGNAADSTHPVATKQPNAWGLYDMSGNVAEWVEDLHFINYSRTTYDGSAWLGYGKERVHRGGSWTSNWDAARAANRSGSVPTNSTKAGGFRVAKTLP
jgi:formylglycine-generating enzyme required for sulfatase activity